VAMQRARIDQAELAKADKQAILYKNAQRVLDLTPLETGALP